MTFGSTFARSRPPDDNSGRLAGERDKIALEANWESL